MPHIVNEDQARFWTEEVGATWAERGSDMDALLANTTAVLTRAAEPQPGETVLDIGCGPGPSSFAAAELIGTAGRVHGVDISETFIEQARTAASTAGARNITFEHADAQVADFDHSTFDLAISRFGVMFFDDTTAAFANIGRSLKPGGRLVMLCWSAPQHNPWFGMTRQVAMDVLGPVDPPAPYAHGPLAFQDITRVTGLLEAAGYRDAKGYEVDIDLVYPGRAVDLASLATEMSGVGPVVRELGASNTDVAAIHALLEKQFNAWTKTDGVHIPARLNLFRAERPTAVRDVRG